MGKTRLNVSIFFRDRLSIEHFLFQVLNFGRNEDDELKFVFNDQDTGTGGAYVESEGKFTGADLIRLQPEVTYHSNGQLHFKMPRYSERTTTEYPNVQQRRPLKEIREWYRFMQYTVVNYDVCKKPRASQKMLVPPNKLLFDETPFRCIFFLGNKVNPTPRSTLTNVATRILDVASELDLLVCIVKTEYRGTLMRIGATDQWVRPKGNPIEILTEEE